MKSSSPYQGEIGRGHVTPLLLSLAKGVEAGFSRTHQGLSARPTQPYRLGEKLRKEPGLPLTDGTDSKFSDLILQLDYHAGVTLVAHVGELVYRILLPHDHLSHLQLESLG